MCFQYKTKMLLQAATDFGSRFGHAPPDQGTKNGSFHLNPLLEVLSPSRRFDGQKVGSARRSGIPHYCLLTRNLSRASCIESLNDSNNLPIDTNQLANHFDFIARRFNRVVLWVFRLQYHPIGAAIEALQCGVQLMDSGHDNLSVFRRGLLSNERQISRHDV